MKLWNHWTVYLLGGIVLLAFLAPTLPIISPSEIHLERANETPGAFAKDAHSLLGTDSKGRDLLSRLIWGSRISLFVGFLGATISLLIGVSYGAISGYLGGKTDLFLMRVVDVLQSLPLIFLVLFLLTILAEYRMELASFGIGRVQVFYLVIGAFFWLNMARIIRANVLSLKQREFIQAAQALGASRTRILVQHLLPNLLPIALAYLALTIPQVILFESFLSFLGLGVEAPGVSWGLLVAEGIESINPLQSSWWLLLFPSLALTLTLWTLNRLGERLRDRFDPKSNQPA